MNHRVSGEMNVSIFGSSYLGVVAGACLADIGHDVTVIADDSDDAQRLDSGESTVHEPEVATLVDRHAGETLFATTSHEAIARTDATIIATPIHRYRGIEESRQKLERISRSIGEQLESKRSYHAVVNQSTVSPGATKSVIAPTIERESGKRLGAEFGIASVPEFLREGRPVESFLQPDRLIVGADDEEAKSIVRDMYRPIIERDGTEVIETTMKSAEMIKFANNVFLAAKISLINELGNICKCFDIDTYEVADALGLDPRIERDFLDSGLGWGGPPFASELEKLIAHDETGDYTPEVLENVVRVNRRQPKRMVDLLARHVTIESSRICVLGLSFKPGTNVVFRSQSLALVELLRRKGGDVVAYDPAVDDQASERLPDVEYAESKQDAITDADAVLIATGWPEFGRLEDARERMTQPLVIDGRNIVEEDERDTLIYEGVTW